MRIENIGRCTFARVMAGVEEGLREETGMVMANGKARFKQPVKRWRVLSNWVGARHMGPGLGMVKDLVMDSGRGW